MKRWNAACIEDNYLFKELPFAERFAAAKAAGFDSVEFWSWRERDIGEIAARVAEAGIPVTSFIGNDRGSGINPADRGLYLESVAESLEVAKRIGSKNIYVFSDEIGPGGICKAAPAISDEAKLDSVVTSVSAAAELADKAGVDLLLEPVNSYYVRGYFLDTVAAAAEAVKRVGHPRVKAVYDFYHQQLVAGNLILNLREVLPYIGCVHVADVPGRHEPGVGEINFTNLARELDSLGYAGTMMYECTPTASTAEALAAIGRFFPLGGCREDSRPDGGDPR